MARPIKIEILGDDRDANRALSRTERGLGKLTRVAGLAGLGMAAGLAAGATALFKIGQTFEKVEGIITRGTGAIGDDMTKLVANTKAVLRTVPESADVVASTLADVNTFFGVNGEQLEVLTKQYLDFARVTEVDVATAVNKLDGVMTQFNVPLEETEEVMGDLIRIAQATGLEMSEFLTQFQTFGPIFANANFSLEETAAVFGQLNQAGVSITRLGPGLNAFFRRTAEAGDDPRRALLELVTAMKEAATSSDALNIATAAVGAEGAQRLTNAIRSGALDIGNLNALMGEGVGILGAQAEATKTFSDRWAEFKNNVLVGLEPLATKVFDAFEGGLERITPLIDPFVEKLGTITAWLTDEAAPVIEEWKDDFVAGLGVVGDSISDWRSDANAALSDVDRSLNEQTDGALSRWGQAWASAGRVVERTNVVLDGFGIDLSAFAKTTLLFAERDLKKFASGFMAGIGAIGLITSSILNALGEVVFIIEKIQEGWKRLVSTFSTKVNIPSFDLPSLPFIGGGSRRAMGSSSTGGPTRLGERGPEDVSLPQGTRVTPAHMSRGNRGGDTYNINGSNLTASQVAKETAWQRRTGNGR